LSHSDYCKLLDSIGQLYSCQDLDSFARLSMRIGRKFAPSDYAIYEEINLRRKRHRWLTDPAQVDLSAPREAHELYFRKHPMLRHMKRTGDMPVMRMSDFFTRRQYHETSLYRELFHRFAVESQLGFSLPSPSPSLKVAQAFQRSQGDFSEEERLMFELLRPHLFQAYRNAEIISQLRDAVTFGERALETAQLGVAVFDARGRVQFCSANARIWLNRFFPCTQSAARNKLPPELLLWVRDSQFPTTSTGHLPPARQPLVVDREHQRLVLRLASDSVPGRQMLIMEEHRTGMSALPLMRLGLTMREAEVLLWVAQGKTSPEIGTILGSSAATVSKHLEHILSKLGVETRTAAAACAWEAMGPV
jgi:DNA-binding CsgD family transcriptional regulator